MCFNCVLLCSTVLLNTFQRYPQQKIVLGFNYFFKFNDSVYRYSDTFNQSD